MKTETKKTLRNIGLLGAGVITAFTIMGCPKDSPEDDPTCQCPDEGEHFLTCDDYECEVGGHSQKELTEVEGFKIFQTNGVTPEEVSAIIDIIEEIYQQGWLTSTEQTNLSEKYDNIYVVTGASSHDKANKKIYINKGADGAEVETLLIAAADASVQKSNSIFLANKVQKLNRQVIVLV